MSRLPRRRAVVLGALVAAPALAVLLSLRPNPELEALKADPLARWQPSSSESGAPRRVLEQDQGLPSLELGPPPGLGDREPAIYERTFFVPQDVGLQPFEAARRAAEEAGWRLDYPGYVTADSPETQTWTTVTGYKELPTGTAVVHIHTDAARPTPDSPPGTNTLVVMLEHTR